MAAFSVTEPVAPLVITGALSLASTTFTVTDFSVVLSPSLAMMVNTYDVFVSKSADARSVTAPVVAWIATTAASPTAGLIDHATWR